MERRSQLDSVGDIYGPVQARPRNSGWTAREGLEPNLLPQSLEEMHSSLRDMTSRRRQRHRIPRSWDERDEELASPTILASPAKLTRAVTESYRRPVNVLARGQPHEYDAPPHLGRSHSTRNTSPAYERSHRMARENDHSRHSSASGLAYGNDNADHIEVMEEVDEGPIMYNQRRQPSRDEYMGSASDGRYRGRRRGPYIEEESTIRTFYTPSDGGSAAHQPSRTPDRSVSSRQGRRLQNGNVIEDSRPPISSKPPLVHRRHRSVEAIRVESPKPRRSSTVRSSRSRAASISAGPVGILGSIFGTSHGRQESPEKRIKEQRSPKKRVECVICMGHISPTKAAKLQCGHSMCRSCLERIFKLSLTDPQHMPPRCCTQEHIPLKHVDRLFDNAFKKTWNRKFAEYSTKNRLYCPSRRCGEWIKPSHIRREEGRKVARCGRCKTKVCCMCNGRWHGSRPCANDEETANILAQAQEEGWKRCYKCKCLVELREGCNHMTCRCGAQFCMICGVKWKNCDCPWFNEDDHRADYPDDMHIRADLGEAFHGPPAPLVDLQGRSGTIAMPVRRRPRTYHEEMHMRRVQEQRDADMARHLQYTPEEYQEEAAIMPGLGEIHENRNTTRGEGYYMSDNHEPDSGGGRFRAPRSMSQTGFSGRASVHGGESRRTRGGSGSMLEISQDGRLADRMAETRHRRRSPPPAMGPINPGGSIPMGAPPRPPSPPVPPQMKQPPRALRHHSLDADTYNRTGYLPPEHGHATEILSQPPQPRSSRRRRRDQERPRSSDLAGLSGPGKGMNRVSQWRTFVEPGVPDGESTVGHA